FFLCIAPWLLIVPAHLLLGNGLDSSLENWRFPLGITALGIGLSLSFWAIHTQWVQGQGTPSLNAPPIRLITVGPYHYCRNPLQLGAICYVFALGSLSFSLAVGLLALVAGALTGIGYIVLIEEKELAIRFGQEYLDYRNRTPFMVPLRFLRKKPQGSPLNDGKKPSDKPLVANVCRNTPISRIKQ
ncbi:MAG: isoprenylcysteine carboxylmethyltransferase family protein, partial [Desulfuromonadaceae bacterium]